MGNRAAIPQHGWMDIERGELFAGQGSGWSRLASLNALLKLRAGAPTAVRPGEGPLEERESIHLSGSIDVKRAESRQNRSL